MSHAKTLGLGTGDLKSNVRPKTTRKIPKNSVLSPVTSRKPSRIADPRQTTSENRTVRTTTTTTITTTGTKKTASRQIRPKKSAPVVAQEPRPVVIPTSFKGSCPSPPVSPRKLLMNLSRAAGIRPPASHGGDFLPGWDPQDENYSSLRPVNLTAPRHFLKTKPPRNRIPKTHKFTLSPFDPDGLENPIGNIDKPVDFQIPARPSPTREHVLPEQSRLEARPSRREVPLLEAETPYLPRLASLAGLRLERMSIPGLDNFESRQIHGIIRDPSEQATNVWHEPLPAPRRQDKISPPNAYSSERVRDFCVQSFSSPDDLEFPDGTTYLSGKLDASSPGSGTYPPRESLLYRTTAPTIASSTETSPPAGYERPFQEIRQETFKTAEQPFPVQKELPHQEFCETDQQPFPKLHPEHCAAVHEPFSVQKELPHQEFCETDQQPFPKLHPEHCAAVHEPFSVQKGLPHPEVCETDQQPFPKLHPEHCAAVHEPFSVQKGLSHQEFCETAQQPFTAYKDLHQKYHQPFLQQFPAQKEHSGSIHQPFQTQKELHQEDCSIGQQSFPAELELHHEFCQTAQQPFPTREEPHQNISQIGHQQFPVQNERCESVQQPFPPQNEPHQDYCQTIQPPSPDQKELNEEYGETAQQSFAAQEELIEEYLSAEQPLPVQRTDPNFCPGQMQSTGCLIRDKEDLNTVRPFHVDGEVPSNNENQTKEPHYHYCWYSRKMVAPEMIHPSHRQIWNGDSGIPYPPLADEGPTLSKDRNVLYESKPTLSLCAVTSSPEDTETEDQYDQSVNESEPPNTILQNQLADSINHDSSNANHVTSVKHPPCSCMNTYSCERQAKDVCSRSGHVRGLCYSGDNWRCYDHGNDETFDYRSNTVHRDNFIDVTRHYMYHNLSDPHKATCGKSSQTAPTWEDSKNGQPQLSDNKYHTAVTSITQMQSTWRLPSECWRSSSHGSCKTRCQYRAGSSPQSLSIWNPTPPPPTSGSLPSTPPPTTPPPSNPPPSTGRTPSPSSSSSPSSESLEKIVPALQPVNTKEAPVQNIETAKRSESSTDCEDISSERDSQRATPHSITPSDFEHLVPPDTDSPDTPSPRSPTPCATPDSQRESDKAHKEDTEIGSEILVPEDTVQTAKGNGVSVGSSLKKATPFTMTLGQPESLPNTYLGDDAASLYVHGDEVVSVPDENTQDADEPGDAGDTMDRASDISSASSAGISETENSDFSASSNEPRMFVPAALSLRVTFANLPILICVVAVSLGSLLLYQNQTY